MRFPSSNPSPPAPGLAPDSPARRGVVLAVCCVSVLLVGIDMTAVNLALPSIGRDFHTGASGLSWIIDAYTLVLATFLMFSASTADRIGRKLVFRIGLGTFVVGSARTLHAQVHRRNPTHPYPENWQWCDEHQVHFVTAIGG